MNRPPSMLESLMRKLEDPVEFNLMLMGAVRTVIVLGLLLLLVTSTLYRVDETEQVVVTFLQRPVRVIMDPGLHVKMPFLETAHRFPRRVLLYDAEPKKIITGDKKNLIVDNYAVWRIVDPLLFLQTVQTREAATLRIDDVIYSRIRHELGRHDLIEIVSYQRALLMEAVTEASDRIARSYGVEVVDVRIKMADLPDETKEHIYARMRAERQREAMLYRSEGEEEGLRIRADADRTRVTLLAGAYREAEQIKGDGDATAVALYAHAYDQEPSFYEFMRTLEAYERALGSNTLILLSPESEFLRFFEGKDPIR